MIGTGSSMSATTEELDIRTYTVEEIDDNLATLSNLLVYSKIADHDNVMRQADNWLDRRLDLRAELG